MVEFLCLIDFVAADYVLIAKVQTTVADYWVSPDASLWISLSRLRIKLELADLLEFFFRREYQRAFSVAFSQAIQHTVGICHCAFAAVLSLVAPDKFARAEVLTEHAVVVTVSVEIITQQQNTAVMILHYFVVVNFFDFVVTCDIEQQATRAVTSRHINLAVFVDRRWNHSDAAGKIMLPQQLSISIQPEDFSFSDLNVLSFAEMIDSDNRRIMSLLFDIR